MVRVSVPPTPPPCPDFCDLRANDAGTVTGPGRGLRGGPGSSGVLPVRRTVDGRELSSSGGGELSYLVKSAWGVEPVSMPTANGLSSERRLRAQRRRADAVWPSTAPTTKRPPQPGIEGSRTLDGGSGRRGRRRSGVHESHTAIANTAVLGSRPETVRRPDVTGSMVPERMDAPATPTGPMEGDEGAGNGQSGVPRCNGQPEYHGFPTTDAGTRPRQTWLDGERDGLRAAEPRVGTSTGLESTRRPPRFMTRAQYPVT